MSTRLPNLKTSEFPRLLEEFLRSTPPATADEIATRFNRSVLTIKLYISSYVDLNTSPICVVGIHNRRRLYGIRGTLPPGDQVTINMIKEFLTVHGPSQHWKIAHGLSIGETVVRRCVHHSPEFTILKKPSTKGQGHPFVALPSHPTETRYLVVEHRPVLKDPDESTQGGEDCYSHPHSLGQSVIRVVPVDSIPERLTTPPFDIMVSQLESKLTKFSPRFKSSRAPQPHV
jgi:hypothetical protein